MKPTCTAWITTEDGTTHHRAWDIDVLPATLDRYQREYGSPVRTIVLDRFEDASVMS